jgi:hypothetical protein
MGWIVGLGLLSSLLLLYYAGPQKSKKWVMAGAHSNVRQLYLSLYEFEVEYGSYPSSLTIPQVRAKTGTSLTLGDDSSNALFKQFFAAKVAGSEQPFFAPGPGLRNPDNHFSSDATMLAKGECNLAYISGLEPTGNPRRPIVFGPIAPGTRSLDRKLFDGKAVLLHLDGSASQHQIERSGKILIDGMDMLDPKHPIWDGKPFTVKWPK